MDREPRADKVAVVDEVRQKMQDADVVVVTEYRGLKVADLAALRATLRQGGGEYKVYKNTLVRRASDSLDWDLADQLTGPTALTFITGDFSQAVKSLKEYTKANPLLVIKGGVMDGDVLNADGILDLANLPTASEIYARIAGGLNSGARDTASVVSGVHRSIAYVLQAAIDAGAFAEGDAPAETAAAPAAATETETAADTDGGTETENSETEES